MSDVAALIADLVAAGTPAALVGRVASALATPSRDEELSADRRERDRIRKRNYREKSIVASAERPRNVPRTVPDPSPPPALPPKEIPHSPLEITLFPTPTPQPRVSGASASFDRFWQGFPNKVGKADASRAFSKALARIDIETLMLGLQRYASKTDDRPWCNPATWLNQDRWTDQPATAPPPRQHQRMTKAQQLGQELRNDIAGRFEFQRSGREEGQDLQPPQRLLAISGKAGS